MRGGDHLRGEWKRNCAPDAIKRPDRYAYGMALPSARGQWDYRLCYQMSYLERERAREALSWSWQPDACEMSKVDGGRFSRWLGGRTMLFWGDSLTAQHFFSLIFLLGDAVVSLRDGDGVTSGGGGGGAGARSRCDYRGLGGEGGRYTEAVLRDGGRILKVLGHAEMRDEMLHGFDKAWWRPMWEGADLIVFNLIGHHLRTLPRAFGRGYRSMVASALDQIVRHTKQSAMLVMRTSNVGHLQCEERFAPLTKRSDAWEQLGGWGWRPAKTAAAHYGAPREGAADKYDWRAPPLHEHAWAKLASANPALGPRRFRVLNVSHVDLRADGHVASAMKQSADTTKSSMGVDCLHYCIPGPSDAWASALFHLLLFTT